MRMCRKIVGRLHGLSGFTCRCNTLWHIKVDETSEMRGIFSVRTGRAIPSCALGGLEMLVSPSFQLGQLSLLVKL